MGSPSKLPVNPTSMGRTVCLYVMMSLLALNYLLDDDVRHVQYKKAQQYASKENPSSLKTPHEPRSTIPTQEQPHRPPLAYSKTQWPSPRNKNAPRDMQGEAMRPERLAGYRMKIALSRMQMCEAWLRMRSVTKLPVEPTMRARRTKKKVSWGDVEVFEYDEHGVVERGH